MTLPSRMAAGLTGVLAAGLLAAAGPATAVTAHGTVKCFEPAAAARADDPNRRDRRIDDLPDVSDKRIRELRRDRSSTARMSQRSLAAVPTVRIPVRVHAIKGRHRGDTYLGPRRAKAQIQTLLEAYNGGQSATNRPTRFEFYLADLDWTRNDRWYHARAGSAAEREMRRRLHEGGRRTLNLYVNRALRYPDGSIDLGWATPPELVAYEPRLDGVVVNIGSMINGRFSWANEGDTAVHEVGHWLGLMHTFEFGCDADLEGDGMPDTPLEATPAFGCPEGRDTCAEDPGVDPIHNFMDYSDDSCMWEFTTDQAGWMSESWELYRA